MKRGELFLLWLFSASILALAVVAFTSCSPAANKQIARTAIDLALAACVAEHPEVDEKELQAVCRYADDVLPLVRELLAAQRKGMVKGGCSPTTMKVTAPDAGK